MPPSRKPSIEEVVALGVDRLARLVLDEAEASAPFAKRVKAALAATRGPAAVAVMIDKRLAGLERARAFVDDDRGRAFESDLETTVDIIVDELGAGNPASAIDRLLRFLATARPVFDRVDDSSGRVQDLYHRAVDAMAPLVARLAEDDKAALPERLARRLADDPWGYATGAATTAVPHLPRSALDRFDGLLADTIEADGDETRDDRDLGHQARIGDLVTIRQAIADRRGDVDAWIALEVDHHRAPDTLAVARRLHDSGRQTEALDWVRRPAQPGIAVMGWSDRADGYQIRRPADRTRVELEAEILDALGQHEAAQTQRWQHFESSLDIEMLRGHVAKLPDFAEFDVLDRAFVHAARHADIHRALALFLDWPRLDLAARHVHDRSGRWDGRHYGALVPAAEALATDHPEAATILYRALLDDILKRAQSSAYAHAAAYLAQLDSLAPRLTSAAVLPDHAAYRAALANAHARKPAFWAQVRKRR